MKTTIDLPEEVLLKAKVFAAKQRTTLRELVMLGLKLATESAERSEQQEREIAIKRILAGMRASNTEPMVLLKREEIYER
jgi:hypothetical protein